MLKNAQTPLLHIADVSGSALFQGDCLDIMPLIPDNSIDMILADLPYGTTACKWDTIIPFEPLWEQYKRIIKDNGAIVLTASQPFTTDLINSQRELFKYELIWNKENGRQPYLAKIQPIKSHENIIVFSKGKIKYNPIWDKIVRKGVEWREMARRYVVRSGKYRGMHYIFWDRQEWWKYLGDRFRCIDSEEVTPREMGMIRESGEKVWILSSDGFVVEALGIKEYASGERWQGGM